MGVKSYFVCERCGKVRNQVFEPDKCEECGSKYFTWFQSKREVDEFVAVLYMVPEQTRG